MTTLNSTPQYDDNHYAVVDLGSNSFHLQITHRINNQFQAVDKVKRKVRLAAGLNCDNILSQEAIERGLDCLQLFAQHLHNIPTQNIRIVATAALRIATNRDDFIAVANKILPRPITLLSGEQEANTIYRGVAHTCQDYCSQQKLVIDIGGASTELIVGNQFNALHAISLNIGCVSYKEKYFTEGRLSQGNFANAIIAAKNEIAPEAEVYIKLGWQIAVGSSGTMQALVELLSHQNKAAIITADFLQEIQQRLIDCRAIDNIKLEGLRPDRAVVLASGLAILIALFECLQITQLQLSTGALREGLLFEMQPKQP